MDSLYQGLLILGSSGSGKTSGAFDHVLRETVLPSGAGILWLCCKGEEAKRALRLAEKANRLQDVIELNPSSGLILDPVDVELRYSGGHGTVESAAALLSDLVSASQGNAGAGGEPYWAQSTERALRRLIHCVIVATGKASLESLYGFMHTVPQSPESLQDPQWQKGFCATCLEAVGERVDNEAALTLTYWRDFWPSWNDRTRSIVERMITNVLDSLVAGVCGRMLNRESNLLPQCLRQGKILVLTPSTLEGKEPARYMAIMCKQLVQRMATRFTAGTPVAIVADEYQQFVAKMKDEADFQAVARSHRVILIAASQTLPCSRSTRAERG